jgi:hypothetical protein
MVAVEALIVGLDWFVPLENRKYHMKFRFSKREF